MGKKSTMFKLMAIAGTGLGFIATLVTDWANSKEQEKIIEEKVNEALAKREAEEES